MKTLMQTGLGLCVFLQSLLSNAHSGQQLSDVAKGLEYLHSHSLIHGDLKPVRSRPVRCFTVLTPRKANVLVDVVDKTPRACIADSGAAVVTRNPDSIRPATRQAGYFPRWSAPEVIKEQNPSMRTDIFSFAMIIIEVRRRWRMTHLGLI